MRHNVLVVDDHEIVREGVKCVLANHPALHVCGEAKNGQEAVEKAVALKPDLVLMDISMPVMGGIEATRQIRRLSPTIKIVVLSLHDSPQIAEHAKKAGANAYVNKSCSAEILFKTILAAVEELDGSSVSVRHTDRTAVDALS